MKAAIVVNGDVSDYDFTRRLLEACDYVVACDGGLMHCHKMAVVPDCIVGDLDSVQCLELYPDIPVLRFPAEKDQSDLELAIEHVCDEGAASLLILGGFGGRFDHQLANIHVLAQAANRGVKAELRDAHTRICLINEYCRLHKTDGNIVSLLPLTTSADGIVTEGLKYPLTNESLFAGFARGLSNLIINEYAEVSMKSGLLVVIQTR